MSQHPRCPGMTGEADMSNSRATTQSLRFAAVALFAISAGAVYAQIAAPTNSLPDPYRSVENWAKMPQGRTWGSTAGVAIDPDGASVWVAERCGANSCAGSDLAPVLKFDASGNLMKSCGAGRFVSGHVNIEDSERNVSVIDAQGELGKNNQSINFKPDGNV